MTNQQAYLQMIDDLNAACALLQGLMRCVWVDPKEEGCMESMFQMILSKALSDAQIDQQEFWDQLFKTVALFSNTSAATVQAAIAVARQTAQESLPFDEIPF